MNLNDLFLLLIYTALFSFLLVICGITDYLPRCPPRAY